MGCFSVVFVCAPEHKLCMDLVYRSVILSGQTCKQVDYWCSFPYCHFLPLSAIHVNEDITILPDHTPLVSNKNKILEVTWCMKHPLITQYYKLGSSSSLLTLPHLTCFYDKCSLSLNKLTPEQAYFVLRKSTIQLNTMFLVVVFVVYIMHVAHLINSPIPSRTHNIAT